MDGSDFDTSTMFNYHDYSGMSLVPPCDKSGINEFAQHFLPPFYLVIFVISVLGNGLVLFVACKFEKLSSVTNIFLVNLVASNLIFTTSLPFYAVYHSSEWRFSLTACKLLGSAYFVGFYSSVLFLTLMTFDRYLAVVHVVVASRQRKSCYAYIATAVVWLVSLLGSLESYLHHEVTNDPMLGKTCDDTSSSDQKYLGVYSQFVLFFLVPLVVVVYCYFRIGLTVISTRMMGKHRTVKLILVIVVLFFMCWSPYNVILLMKEQESDDPCDDSLVYAQYITHNIAHLYFCINPVFYTFVGRKFQNHVRRLTVNKMPCLRNYLSIAGSSRSVS